MEVAWKTELANCPKGETVKMYGMLSVNITSPEQASAKLVIQCPAPLYYVPASGTGIAALLAKPPHPDAKEKNARLLLIWGTRSGQFCPVGACIRATKKIPANTEVVL